MSCYLCLGMVISGYVRLVRLVHVTSSNVLLGQVISGYNRLGQVTSDLYKLVHVKAGNARKGLVRPG
jgi:hypothetical protein